MVGKTAQMIKKYGVSHANSQLVLRILDSFIEKKCDLRCHCNPKNPHYCALSEAFKFIDMVTEDGIEIIKYRFIDIIKFTCFEVALSWSHLQKFIQLEGV